MDQQWIWKKKKNKKSFILILFNLFLNINYIHNGLKCIKNTYGKIILVKLNFVSQFANITNKKLKYLKMNKIINGRTNPNIKYFLCLVLVCIE